MFVSYSNKWIHQSYNSMRPHIPFIFWGAQLGVKLEQIWPLWLCAAHTGVFCDYVNVSSLSFFFLQHSQSPSFPLLRTNISLSLWGELVWPNRDDLLAAENSHGYLWNKCITHWTLSACNFIWSLAPRLFPLFCFFFSSGNGDAAEIRLLLKECTERKRGRRRQSGESLCC